MREEKLQQIKEMILLMKELIDEDFAASVWDTQGTVLHFQKANTFPLHFDIGFRLDDKNDKIFQAMRNGKTVHNILPKEVFGVSIEGNLVPIFEDGKVVGCIACVYSLEKFDEIEKKQSEIKSVLEDSKHSVSDILNATINASNHLKEIHKYVDNLDKSVGGVYNVVESIKVNTSRTKMLALNASIEAARAGESGKGFKIVANEMGKLSQMSAESVTHINETLNEMVKSIKDVTNAINQMDDASFKNSEVVENIITELNRV